MKVKVTTLWGSGFVSVASKYVDKALKQEEGLEIDYKGTVGKVTFEKLKDKRPREATFKDKFGRPKSYSLYDFFWNDIK